MTHTVKAGPDRQLMELSEAEWAAAAEAPLRAARLALREAVARGESLVFVLPTCGVTGAAGRVPVSAVAEGVRSLARSVSMTLPAGITVNCVLADDPDEDLSAVLEILAVGGLSGQTLTLGGALM